MKLRTFGTSSDGGHLSLQRIQMPSSGYNCHMWCNKYAGRSDNPYIPRCGRGPCFLMHNKYMRNSEQLIPQPACKPDQPLRGIYCTCTCGYRPEQAQRLPALAQRLLAWSTAGQEKGD